MKNPEKKPSALRRLLGTLGASRGMMIGAIFLLFLAVVANALAPLFSGFTINALGDILKGNASDEVVNRFIVTLCAMIAGYVVYSVLSYIASKMLISATQKAVYDLRKQIDQKLSALPLNYYDTTTYGDILARLTNDVNIVSDSLQTSIFTMLHAIFTLVIVFIMMIGISGWLTLLGLLPLPILIYICNKISKKSEKDFDDRMKKTGDLNGYVEEYYNGQIVVAACGKEEAVEDGFKKIDEDLTKCSVMGEYRAGILYPLTMAMNDISLVIVAVFGAIIAIMGGLSIGMIQTFAQYLAQFTSPIGEMMQITSLVQTTRAASERIFEFLDEEEEVAETTTPQFPEPLQGAVDFDHVKFGYLPHQTLISDLDIRVKAGSKTAIVGPTGAGKTTLVNLIMRFYDVKSGAIRIDGIDIRDMKREKLRDIFGMVLQETWLYSGTVMENIRYGNLNATDEEVIEAAKAARCDSFIRSLPGGYQFVLQEGASNIAQGQRQLLTIARALINDPPIMILDEATSSVDTRTEILVQEAMNNMMKGRTSFIIAHRLSTIKDADTILYMQDGDILEVGNHESLMAKNGLYAKLYNSQFSDKK